MATHSASVYPNTKEHRPPYRAHCLKIPATHLLAALILNVPSFPMATLNARACLVLWKVPTLFEVALNHVIPAIQIHAANMQSVTPHEIQSVTAPNHMLAIHLEDVRYQLLYPIYVHPDRVAKTLTVMLLTAKNNVSVDRDTSVMRMLVAENHPDQFANRILVVPRHNVSSYRVAKQRVNVLTDWEETHRHQSDVMAMNAESMKSVMMIRLALD